MDRTHQRELQILTAIEERAAITQRDLASRLGIALGLTNLYLKRLARKGYIKIVAFPRKPAARKRLHYLLTPHGIAEKARLSYEHMAYSVHLYRRTRQHLREALAQLPESGLKRVALYGADEAAELAYLTLRGYGLEPIGVFASGDRREFLGYVVRDPAELVGESFDAVVVATFDRPEPELARLAALGLPREKLLTLRRLAADEAAT
jgi:DNA-binding MarR family transcriptional regulator